MGEKILDGINAAIAIMRSMQHNDSISDDLAEDAMCMESFLNRMRDKMTKTEMRAFRPTRRAGSSGSSETGLQRPN